MKKRIRGAHSLRYPSIFVNFLSLFVGRGAGGWGQVGYQGGLLAEKSQNDEAVDVGRAPEEMDEDNDIRPP